MKHRTTRRGLAVKLSVLMVAGLLGGLAGGSSVSAQTAVRARGNAYAVGETFNNVHFAEVTAEVPPPDAYSERDVVLSVGTTEVGETEADGCVEAGASAKLQRNINGARIVARGDTINAGDSDAPNQNPNDPDPERGRVQVSDNFPNERCVTPVAPETPPTDPDPGESGCERVTAPAPAPTPGATPAPRRVCDTNLPLWNARGYAKAQEATLLGVDIEAEAVGRCVGIGEPPVYATGARFGNSELLGAEDFEPNQRLNPLDLGLAQSATVIFWETNWDPKSGEIIDGKDHVWVNGMHIYTPTEEIIISHAEAEVDCPQPDPTPTESPSPNPTVPPPGGFPRDVNLETSKNIVKYNKIVTLAGSVTPATNFETPRSCIENVNVDIRRDDVGGTEDFQTIATVQTDNRGNFAYNFRGDSNAQYIAHIPKDEPVDCAESSSEPRGVNVRPAVGLKISDATPKRGSRIAFLVRVKPCGDHVGTRVVLRRQYGARTVGLNGKRLDENCEAVFRRKANYKEAVFDAVWARQDGDHQTGRALPKVVTTHR